ncbi:hypothetical protein [Fimbriiglobus ruber]|uniref:hypothetical protein n=1 Tax=Fimbriiglobus ruber TaxID=1908690 RepID=UPI00117A5E00|nr:hypothetical protein [Fimbriiglobus ruber]
MAWVEMSFKTDEFAAQFQGQSTGEPMKRGILVIGTLSAVSLVLWLLVWHVPSDCLAERHQHIVQAICDYRALNGMLPYDLEELVPNYLPTVPSAYPGYQLYYSNDVLIIHAGRGGSGVSYHFSEHEGWEASGRVLNLPRVTPSVVPIVGEDLVRARLAAYNRRIQASPANLWHRNQKISYLKSLGRRTDAIAECEASALAHPDWWRPQMALAVFAPPTEVAAAEGRFRSWIDHHPAFIHYWYLARYYRDQGRTADALAALHLAAKYPLEQVDSDAGWVPAAYALDAATFACQRRSPELVLAIATAWSSPRGVYSYQSPEVPAFRAAARLALGQFEEARTEADVVLATSRERRMWIDNLDQLDAAVQRRDRSFVYDPGPMCCGWAWSLFPPDE